MKENRFLTKVKSFFNETHKLKTKDICLIGVLLALGIVLSSFLQFRLIGDIKVDLSYLVIVIICYLYGGLIGSISAALIALLESTLFGAYGISISWICANLVIGAITGTALHLKYKSKVKPIIDVATIIVSCAIGLLLVKTLIECKLYNIPFAIKIVKNAVAFGVDCGCMIIGYLAFLPKVLKTIKVKTVEEDKPDPITEDCRTILREVHLHSGFPDINSLNDARGYWELFSGDEGWKEVNDLNIDAFLDYLDYLINDGR